MRLRSLIFAVAATVGAGLFVAAPASAMPVQSSITADAPISVEKVGYYGDGNYYHHRRYGRPYHSPSYIYRERHGLHSPEYLRDTYRRHYAPWDGRYSHYRHYHRYRPYY